MKGRFVPQEVAPRHDNGVDFSGPGAILVKTKKRRLVWRKGRHYYSGMLHPSVYAPADLEVIGFPENIRSMGDFLSREVFVGGRLTRRRVEEALPKIRELMMLPELGMDQVDLKRTFIVDEGGMGAEETAGAAQGRPGRES